MTDGKLIIALDDYINPKRGRKIFGCANIFDHAAKQNQSKYPWAQNIVMIGLVKVVKERWARLPLSYRFYHLKKSIENMKPGINGRKIKFLTKLEQATCMITDIAETFRQADIITTTDSWFGNDGLWTPLRQQLGSQFHLISRLRSNNNIFDRPLPQTERSVGRPRKYGEKLGNTSLLAAQYKDFASEYAVHLYGRIRTVVAYDRIVMLKTLKCPVKVVWVYRKKQWIVLFSTDLTLSVQQIIEYYEARWKIEAAFKELKQDIGSIESQNRHPIAVKNHLHFCMMATSLAWIYASRLEKTPCRPHAVNGRNHFAFSDVRRLIAKAALDDNFGILSPVPCKSTVNSIVTALLRMAA